nr:VOC family protein [Bradyrhizobium sp. AUGA SZCCT0177]
MTAARGSGRCDKRGRAFAVITGLDHVVVLTGDISAGEAAYQTLFGRTPAWRNSGDGAERVLFTLDNVTLELMAPSGDGEAAERIRAVLAAQGEGLASLCFRTNDITKLHRRLDRLTLKPEPVAEVESRDAVTEATLSWKRTRAATDATRGIRMFFLELAKERPLSVRTGPASITAMDHVVVSTPDPERAAALYGARLGLDMALDRSHPDWGRLMFFRCGDLIVEVTHRPGKPADGAQDKLQDKLRDRLRGLCWRVADIDATHARLTAAGVDVSEIRTGRKPGTRVMTVRNGTCGVPTLLVQPSVKP